MAGGTLPELDEQLIIANAQQAFAPFGQFWDVRQAYSEGFAAPANWVAVPGYGPAAPPTGGFFLAGDISDPPEIEVTATRVPITELSSYELEQLGTFEANLELGYRKGEPPSFTGYPDLPAQRPLEEYSDSELLDLGTDSALYELDERRGVPESERAFAPSPLYWPQVVAPAVRGVLTWISGLPLIGLLVPGPAGNYDETLDLPLDFRAPPRRPPPPLPFSLDPIMPPNWNDLVDWPDSIPTQRPAVPWDVPDVRIGDPIRRTAPDPIGPGILQPFNDPLSVPELQPFRAPKPNPVRTPSPFVVPGNPTDPGLDPRRFAYPFPDPSSRPFGVPDLPNPFRYPTPDPVTVAPPQPVTPPGGFPFDTLGPVGNPFADPLQFAQPQPQPRRADPCNCADTKKKKKKEKRKPREICYRGTYREYADGTTKKKLEQVPCEKKGKLDKASRLGSTLSPILFGSPF